LVIPIRIYGFIREKTLKKMFSTWFDQIERMKNLVIGTV